MNQVLQKPGLLVLVAFLTCSSLPSQAATINVDCPGQSLQAAVDVAQAGDIIQVTGGCSENILIRNEKQRVTIQSAPLVGGVGGPDATLPTINVRGKGILIQGLIITGGSSGIHVNRGSNAVINGNTIDSIAFGIQVNQQSYAVITSNTITGNAVGIHVDESSTVRVGYNLATDISTSPNIITDNTYGISVDGNSNAKIAGNTISGGNRGINLRQQAHALIAGNNIGNNIVGIYIELNSSADLADIFEGIPFLNLPNNSNAGSNVIGISCSRGGYVQGVIGSLFGSSGTKSISAPCQDIT